MPQDELPIIELALSGKQLKIKATAEALIVLQSAIVSAIAQTTSEAELLEPNANILSVMIERQTFS